MGEARQGGRMYDGGGDRFMFRAVAMAAIQTAIGGCLIGQR